MKTNLDLYPFAQAPRFVDGEVDMCQSNAILRFIGNKYNMGANGLAEGALMDMMLDGVEGMRGKYIALIYQDKLEGKDAYFQTHICSTTATNGLKNGGAHVIYLEKLLSRNESTSGWALSAVDPSIVDAALFDITDLHLRIFGEQLAAAAPGLVAHHAKFAEVAGVKKYLASSRRLPAVNNNGLG
ncbi:MAG: hypothetical protein WDW38_001000 [Sanguina aurantia]